MNRKTDGQKHRRTQRQTDRRTDVQKGMHAERWTKRQTDDSWMDGHTYRQTEKETRNRLTGRQRQTDMHSEGQTERKRGEGEILTI